ncbi:MAG: hypothetical protein ACI4VC_00665 [Clostridia bacterium]
MVPDNRGNQSSLDPNVLFASMMNGNNGFGGNGNWMWVVFLFFLYPLMRNGGFCGNNDGNSGNLGSLGNLVNNDSGRELLMQAINGNANALRDLAAMLNTSTSSIQQAICGVNNSITQLSGQVGMNGQQIINAIQLGNQGLAAQLAQCCCDLRTAVTTGNYENQIATLNQTNTLQSGQNFINRSIERGFSDTAYAFRDQTCKLGSDIQNSTQQIKDATTAQTNAIISKLDSMERTGLMDKIDAQREMISTLKTNANIAVQNAATQQAIAAATAPLAAQLAEIKCAQPNTVTVPYYPFSVQPNCGCGNYANYGSCQNQFWY